jgi:uncharacterized membrane protein
MDMGSTGLRNIDWGPYEEDTAEKFEILKAKLREADYVVYSSKRIYDSVDELPERYPMTNLYYEAMRDGRLGFEMAQEVTSPPRIFGWSFDDRHADESWSLYDHPQVTIYRKVRDLSDAEYDALFARTWEQAIPYYRGKDSPLSPLLEALGLGSQPASAERGLVSAVVGLLAGEADSGLEIQSERISGRADLMLDQSLAQLPLVDNYRWNAIASESTWLSVVVWWLAVALLGWTTWPFLFALLPALRDRGYLMSKTFGWLVAGWLLWVSASTGLMHNTVRSAWLVCGLLIVMGALAGWRQRRVIGEWIGPRRGLLVALEALFGAAFLAFVLIRMANPDLWQPWFGGEKFMEFAFLNGILRSPTFPPVDPHFAGGYINYYYYGLFLVAFLVKLTGIYAEVAFNLAIAMLFAMTAANAFALAFTAGVGSRTEAQIPSPSAPTPYTLAPARASTPVFSGFGAAMLAPLFVGLVGNLDGFGQIVRVLAERSTIQVQSALPGVEVLVAGMVGLMQVATGRATLPPYDFWGPSRVIPNTINEFPYWSFLFADLHPHLISMPIALLLLGVILAGILVRQTNRRWWGRQVTALLILCTFLLGTLASANLWDLPTYFGLVTLGLLVSEFRANGRALSASRWLLVAVSALLMLAGAFVFYLPFFRSFANVGVAGIGWVRAGDDLGPWLLIWGFLGFVMVSWLFYGVTQRAYPYARRGPISVHQAHADLPAGESSAEVDILLQPTPAAPPAAPDERTDYVAVPSSLAGSTADRGGQGFDADSPKPTGVERLARAVVVRFDRLPRLLYLHARLVRQPTLAYLLAAALIPATLMAAGVSLVWGRTVLALCLAPIGFAFLVLWRRGAGVDGGAAFANLLAFTGLAILAGTQVIYLKDFLQGGDWYRMNTVFKFFIQVWLLWAVAAAIAMPRLWAACNAWFRYGPWLSGEQQRKPSTPHEVPFAGAARVELRSRELQDMGEAGALPSGARWLQRRLLPRAWQLLCVALLVMSSAYLLWGTPARLSQRLVGWRPPFGTLNGLEYMAQGRYSWPDDGHQIELRHDAQAIRWLLDNVRGNPVVMETAEVDYYRAGSSRVASLTGLSGLRGMHAPEQRYAEQVATRDSLHREFWETGDPARTQEILDELAVSLIYVGQLERFLHPEGVAKLEAMADEGRLAPIYQNEGVVIYAVPGRMVATPQGYLVPQLPEAGHDGASDTGYNDAPALTGGGQA